MFRIAINGFGRIGRNIVRAIHERPELQESIQIVAINDLGDSRVNGHLLSFDTVHGRFNQEVEASDDAIFINGEKIKCFSERNPADLPWGSLTLILFANVLVFSPIVTKQIYTFRREQKRC